MRKSIEAELLKLNDLEFRELEHRMHLASALRTFMQKFNLEDAVVAQRIGFPRDKLIRILRCAHNWDLNDLACLQEFQKDCEVEKVAENAKQLVGFSAFKDQIPIQYRNLIDALDKMQGADRAEITLAFPNFRETFSRPGATAGKLVK